MPFAVPNQLKSSPPLSDSGSFGIGESRALHPRARSHAGQDGYIMLVAIFFLALLVLSLAVAAPTVAKSIQHDRDLETYHRGMQYRRAVQLYYRKFHAYPPNIDALVNTNNIRFLRKRYTDPMTGKDDWKPVMWGQNKTPTAMGFFGQPLANGATTLAGIGPSGGNAPAGSTSAFGGSGSSSGSAFGSNSAFGSGSQSGGSIFGSSSSGSSSGSTSSPTDNSGTSGGASTSPSTSGTSTGTGSSSNSGSGPATSGQTFGGAGIIGFSPGIARQSILVVKKKNHYNEWEFTYDPISDMQNMSGGNTGAIGQPASGTTNPVGSSPFGSSTFGNPGSSSGAGSTGSGSGFGSGTNPGSSPTTPQQ
jgi:hypothetical protein